MKKKIALTTIVIVVTTTSIVLADNIEIHKEGNKSFIEVEDFINKLGGSVSKNDEKLVIKANYKNIEMDLNSPFANINGNYSSIEKVEVDGYNVPTDTKVMDKSDTMYIPIDFFKENSVADYVVEGNKVIIKDIVENDPENEDNNNVSRPSNNNSQNNSNSSNQGNNNQNNNNRPNNPNRPNRPNTPSNPNRPSTPENPSNPNKPDDSKPPSTGNGDSNGNGDNNSNDNSGSTGNGNPPESNGGSGNNGDNSTEN